MVRAKPNTAHEAIGSLDRKGRLLALITQNIDNLHEQGGARSDKIIRLHGTNSEAVCLSCGDIRPIEEVLAVIAEVEFEPMCARCAGFIKPNTISFGQSLRAEDLAAAEKATRECDLFMALGSSLQVQPASSFVGLAYDSGKPVVIINRDGTPYDDIAEISIRGSLSSILPQVLE